MAKQLQYIGIIHSDLKRLEDCPLQENENAPEATVEVFTKFSEGMTDIKAGDDLVLFTWLDKADRSVLKTKPRNNQHAPVTGVFSTRSPDRPNPIGMHQVTVLSVLSGNKIVVSGLEVLDQTPLVDIKPDLRKTNV